MRPIHRRDLLVRACSLGSLACGIASGEGAPRKPKVVVTGGHPGDPEDGCGGTIARYADLGHAVVLLYLNDGVFSGKPMDGVRVAEAGKACEILGASPIFAVQVDGEATAMGRFEEEIEKAVVLALFVPLIISSGGNSGSQAATLIIRALALGEVELRDYWSATRREILSGLMLGTLLGSVGFLRIAAWSAFSGIYGPHWALVGLTVALSLVGIVLWGTLSGSMLPFLLKRLGFDPAASSAPFVATLVDATGLVIYFSVAMVVLRGTLL